MQVALGRRAALEVLESRCLLAAVSWQSEIIATSNLAPAMAIAASTSPSVRLLSALSMDGVMTVRGGIVDGQANASYLLTLAQGSSTSGPDSTIGTLSILAGADGAAEFERVFPYVLPEGAYLFAKLADSQGVESPYSPPILNLQRYLPGDANGDLSVDGGDYVNWADHFRAHDAVYSQGDYTGDGVVDGADYTVWSDHFHQSVAVWEGLHSRYWDDSANWINGKLPGPADIVLIAGSQYPRPSVIIRAGEISVRGIQSGQAIELLGGSLRVADSLETAALTVNGGTLIDATLNERAEGSKIEFLSGTLKNITLNTAAKSYPNNFDSRLLVTDRIEINSVFTVVGFLWFGNGTSATVSGNGVLEIGANVGTLIVNRCGDAETPGTLEIGAGVVLRGQRGQLTNEYATGTIVNRGRIEAKRIQSPSGWETGLELLAGDTGHFRNEGELLIEEGGQLRLGGDWSNQGTIQLLNGKLNFGGDFAMTDLGSFDRQSGIVQIVGVLNGDVRLDQSTGIWILQGGTVKNGVIDLTTDVKLGLGTGYSYLDNVVIQGYLLAPNSSFLKIRNGLTLNGTIEGGNSGNFLYFVDGDSPGLFLRGSGEVVSNLRSFTTSPLIQNTSQREGAAGTLTIESGITLRGRRFAISNSDPRGTIVNQGRILAETANDQYSIVDYGSFVNQGIIEARPGSRLTVGGKWKNLGTITADQATIVLGGEFRREDVGELQAASIELSGVVLGDFDFDAITASWKLNRATFKDGIITRSIASDVISDIGGLTLDNATLSGDFTLRGGAQVRHGLRQVGNLRLEGPLAFDSRDAVQSWWGTGIARLVGANVTLGNTDLASELIIEGVSLEVENGGILGFVSKGRITNRSRVTIFELGSFQLGAYGTTVQAGLVEVRPGASLSLGGAWTNEGQILARSAVLSLNGSYSSQELAGIDYLGAVVNLAGTMTGDLEVNNVAAAWNVKAGAKFVNSTLTRQGTTQLNFERDSWYAFDNVHVTYDLKFPGGASLGIYNALQLDAMIAFGVGGGSCGVVFGDSSGNQVPVLTGGGVFHFSNQDGSSINCWSQTTPAIIPSTMLVRGGFLKVGRGIVNQGTMEFYYSLTILGDGKGTFVNEGAIRMPNGGKLLLNGDWTNLGLIQTQSATVTLKGNLTRERVGELQNVNSTILLSGVYSGDLELNAQTGSWTLAGGTIQNGRITGHDGYGITAQEMKTGEPNNLLDHVVLACDLDLAADTNLTLHIKGDLEFIGVARLGQNTKSGGLIFDDDADRTLSGSGVILFDGYGSNKISLTAANRELRIAPGIIISGKYGNIDASVVRNQGRIIAEYNTSFSYRTLLINEGILEVSGNTRFMKFWQNSGSIILRSTANVELSGTFEQRPGGSLTLEVNSSSRSPRLKIVGGATLGGSLSVRFTDGFSPAAGTMLTLINYADFTGDFDAVDLGSIVGDFSLGPQSASLEILPP
jgi:hypothetical protein